MNNRNAELAGRALLYQDGHVSLAVAIKISTQKEWVHVKRDFVLVAERTIGDRFLEHPRHVMTLRSRIRWSRLREIGSNYRFCL